MFFSFPLFVLNTYILNWRETKKELLLSISGDILLLLLKRVYKGKLKLDVILECMGGKRSTHGSSSDTDYRGKDELKYELRSR